MEELFYKMIFKRKSFHLFKEIQKIDDSELKDIEEKYKTFMPLVNDIRTDIRIVSAEETTCKRGEEYCILLYSEKKDNYLQNIGYIGGQLDLYLASLNIGALWFGIGKTEDTQWNGFDFVIMIAIAKVADEKFRKDMFKSKRKPLEEIWQGEFYRDIGNIARFTPSACNTQPWIVEAYERELRVYRYKKPGKRGIMPKDKVTYYNRIDIGIFLLFLELCLEQNGIEFDRTLFVDNCDDEIERVPVARYGLR
ncbi:MAG: nitroreductase family protein [Lachnospiraceae bacterium]